METNFAPIAAWIRHHFDAGETPASIETSLHMSYGSAELHRMVWVKFGTVQDLIQDALDRKI